MQACDTSNQLIAFNMFPNVVISELIFNYSANKLQLLSFFSHNKQSLLFIDFSVGLTEVDL